MEQGKVKETLVTGAGAMRSLVDTLVTMLIGALTFVFCVSACLYIRSQADYVKCKSNMRQLAMALECHLEAYGNFPKGTIYNEDLSIEDRMSWMVQILPCVDSGARAPNRTLSWKDPSNYDYVSNRVLIYECPSEGTQTKSDYGQASYVGISGHGIESPYNNTPPDQEGVMGYERAIKLSQITRGLSNVATAAETLTNVGPWCSGGYTTVRGSHKNVYSNVGLSATFGSYHHVHGVRGANFLFADGSVRYISQSITTDELKAIVTISP